MTDYKELFYWVSVSDNAKEFFGWFAILFTLIFIIVSIVRVTYWFSVLENENVDDAMKTIVKVNKWTWYSTPFMLLFLSLWIFTPSKKDFLLIIAGGETLNYLSNNDEAKEVPNDIFRYVKSELNKLASENEVELLVNEEKSKLLEKTKKELTNEIENLDLKELLLLLEQKNNKKK